MLFEGGAVYALCTQEMQVEELHDISLGVAIVHKMHERNPNTLQMAAS